MRRRGGPVLPLPALAAQTVRMRIRILIRGRAPQPARRLYRPLFAIVASATLFGSCVAESRPSAADAPPGVGPVESLASPAAEGSAEPQLAVGADGLVHLAWLEPADSGTHALRVATWRDDSWSAPRTVVRRDDLFVNWADFPSLLPLGDGRLVAHWLQRGSSRGAYGVRMARSADGGATWTAPVTPHRDGTPTEHGFLSMQPVGDSVLAVWLDGRGYAAGTAADDHATHAAAGEMMLMSAWLDADGTVGAEQRLDARTCDCCQTSMAITSRGPIAVYRDRSADEIRDIAVVRLVDGHLDGAAARARRQLAHGGVSGERTGGGSER